MRCYSITRKSAERTAQVDTEIYQGRWAGKIHADQMPTCWYIQQETVVGSTMDVSATRNSVLVTSHTRNLHILIFSLR